MKVPITEAAWCKAWTAFARSNTGIVGSNPTWDMNVCVRLFCVCVVLCAASGLLTGWSPVQEVLPTMWKIKNLKKRPSSNNCRATDIMKVWNCSLNAVYKPTFKWRIVNLTRERSINILAVFIYQFFICRHWISICFYWLQKLFTDIWNCSHCADFLFEPTDSLLKFIPAAVNGLV
jgi:hypothetical protein